MNPSDGNWIASTWTCAWLSLFLITVIEFEMASREEGRAFVNGKRVCK
jgi:hypothetical protein